MIEPGRTTQTLQVGGPLIEPRDDGPLSEFSEHVPATPPRWISGFRNHASRRRRWVSACHGRTVRARVLGQTRYIADLAMPHMVYARIKRAGIPSARILNVDVREAQRMPGVLAVLTARDIPVNSFGPSLQDQPILADDRVSTRETA